MSAETLAAVFGAAGRLVGYLAIVTIGGVAGFTAVVRGPWQRVAGDGANAILRRVQSVGLAAALVLIVATLWGLYAQAYSIFGVDESVTWEYLRLVALETGWGLGWRWQLSAGIAAAVLLGAGMSFARVRMLGAAGAALIVIATVPLTGHAVSGEGNTWLSVIVQIAHVGGASLWIGTLLVVMAMIRPGSPKAFAAAVRAFSPLAVGAVSTVVGAGLLTTIIYLDSISELWSGVYGRVLLLKVLLFGAVAGLGAYNWRRLKPVLDQPKQVARITRTAGAELLLAGVMLGVTAVLVALPLLSH